MNLTAIVREIYGEAMPSVPAFGNEYVEAAFYRRLLKESKTAPPVIFLDFEACLLKPATACLPAETVDAFRRFKSAIQSLGAFVALTGQPPQALLHRSTATLAPSRVIDCGGHVEPQAYSGPDAWRVRGVEITQWLERYPFPVYAIVDSKMGASFGYPGLVVQTAPVRGLIREQCDALEGEVRLMLKKHREAQ